MPDPSPADELRAAAAIVRVLAAAAHAVDPAPWHAVDLRPGTDLDHATISTAERPLLHGPPRPLFVQGPSARWIALMGPNVGAALADWLDSVAVEMTAVDGTEYAYEEYPSWIAALATARAILTGGQP